MKLIIKSRDNALARRARAVRAGKDEELIFVEGLRLAEEAARSALDVDSVICTEEFARDERGRQLLQRFGAGKISLITENVFASLSDTKTPQGIIILAVRPQTGRALLQRANGPPLIVIMHRLNNPSNAGAILRTAEAAGATGIIATAGTTNLFSPKALRGAMGSSFRLPLWTKASYEEAVSWCRRQGVRLVGSDLRAVKSHTEVDWRAPAALVIGTEATGLLAAEADALDERVRIPMRPFVESLNVAVASAIILYEAARQRAVKSEM